MARRILPLSDTQCRTLKFSARTGNRIFDGGGLFLEARESGSRLLGVLPRNQLYDAELGIPERHHYYNAIQWQPSSVGPVVVYLNDRGTEVLAINLGTDQEVRLFRRDAGVNGFRTHRLENGHLGVTAQLAFKHETVSVEDAFSGLIESED